MPAPAQLTTTCVPTRRDASLARSAHNSTHPLESAVRAASYLSAEFRMGPLGQQSPQSWALKRLPPSHQELGLDLELLIEQKPNGTRQWRLGRLAAVSSIPWDLGFPQPVTASAMSGIFDQNQDGWQVRYTTIGWTAIPGNCAGRVCREWAFMPDRTMDRCEAATGSRFRNGGEGNTHEHAIVGYRSARIFCAVALPKRDPLFRALQIGRLRRRGRGKSVFAENITKVL